MTDPSANIQNVLKVITPQGEVMKKWFEHFDFYKWLPTKSNFGGRYQEVPIGYDTGGGVGHDFNAAQESEQNENQYEQFKIYRTRDYGLVYINNEDIEAAEGDENGFVSMLEDRVDGVDNKLKTRLAYEFWSDGGGAIFKTAVVTPGAPGTITLADPEAIFRLSKNDLLQASTDSGLGGAGVKGGSPGYIKVLTIDEDANSFTVDDTTKITGLANADWLFKKGDYGKGIKGIPAYIPDTATLAANPTLWGVTRTNQKQKLAGIRFDGTPFGLAEALERGLSRGRKSSVYPDAIWINQKYYTLLSLELGAKAHREFVKIGQFGFDVIHVFANGRKVPVMADQNVPDAVAFALTRKSWVWHTLKGCPRWMTSAGSASIVKPTADGVEGRRGWRGQMVNRMPGENIRIAMPT